MGQTHAITEVVGKSKALSVIEHMQTGMTMKDACKAVGINSRTFSSLLSKHPEIQQEMQDHLRARISSITDSLFSSHEENTKSLMKFAAVLRERLEADIFANDAARDLMKIDTHLQGTMKILFPSGVVTQNTEEPKNEISDASRILSEWRGANLRRVDVRVESYRVEIDSTDKESTETEVIDVSSEDIK